jgi:hypothetical protein
MPIASGSQTRIAYVAETVFGTTPANPTFKVLRAVSSSMRAQKQVVTSEELRADRNVSDEVQTGIAVSGDIAGELAYGAWDDLLEGALMSTWATNVLKNGGTPKYFTFEETLETGATDSYSRFTGCMVDRFSMDLKTRQIVSLQASLRGKNETTGTAALVGSTYTAANTEAVQAAPAGVASLTILGQTVKARSLSWEINNNLRERPVIDSLTTEEFGVGDADVTGQIEAYFEGNTLYDAMLAHTSGSVSMTIGTVANKKYTILLPKVIIGDGQKQRRSKDEDVILTLPFRAVFDTTEGASIKITRAVA